jgi:hypothetical protein
MTMMMVIIIVVIVVVIIIVLSTVYCGPAATMAWQRCQRSPHLFDFVTAVWLRQHLWQAAATWCSVLVHMQRRWRTVPPKILTSVIEPVPKCQFCSSGRDGGFGSASVVV